METIREAMPKELGVQPANPRRKGIDIIWHRFKSVRMSEGDGSNETIGDVGDESYQPQYIPLGNHGKLTYLHNLLSVILVEKRRIEQVMELDPIRRLP